LHDRDEHQWVSKRENTAAVFTNPGRRWVQNLYNGQDTYHAKVASSSKSNRLVIRRSNKYVPLQLLYYNESKQKNEKRNFLRNRIT